MLNQFLLILMAALLVLLLVTLCCMVLQLRVQAFLIPAGGGFANQILGPVKLYGLLDVLSKVPASQSSPAGPGGSGSYQDVSRYAVGPGTPQQSYQTTPTPSVYTVYKYSPPLNLPSYQPQSIGPAIFIPVTPSTYVDKGTPYPEVSQFAVGPGYTSQQGYTTTPTPAYAPLDERRHHSNPFSEEHRPGGHFRPELNPYPSYPGSSYSSGPGGTNGYTGNNFNNGPINGPGYGSIFQVTGGFFPTPNPVNPLNAYVPTPPAIGFNPGPGVSLNYNGGQYYGTPNTNSYQNVQPSYGGNSNGFPPGVSVLVSPNGYQVPPPVSVPVYNGNTNGNSAPAVSVSVSPVFYLPVAAGQPPAYGGAGIANYVPSNENAVPTLATYQPPLRPLPPSHGSNYNKAPQQVGSYQSISGSGTYGGTGNGGSHGSTGCNGGYDSGKSGATGYKCGTDIGYGGGGNGNQGVKGPGYSPNGNTGSNSNYGSSSGSYTLIPPIPYPPAIPPPPSATAFYPPPTGFPGIGYQGGNYGNAGGGTYPLISGGSYGYNGDGSGGLGLSAPFYGSAHEIYGANSGQNDYQKVDSSHYGTSQGYQNEGGGGNGYQKSNGQLPSGQPYRDPSGGISLSYNGYGGSSNNYDSSSQNVNGQYSSGNTESSLTYDPPNIYQKPSDVPYDQSGPLAYHGASGGSYSTDSASADLLAQLHAYASRLKSENGGRGSYTGSITGSEGGYGANRPFLFTTDQTAASLNERTKQPSAGDTHSAVGSLGTVSESNALLALAINTLLDENAQAQYRSTLDVRLLTTTPSSPESKDASSHLNTFFQSALDILKRRLAT